MKYYYFLENCQEVAILKENEDIINSSYHSNCCPFITYSELNLLAPTLSTEDTKVDKAYPIPKGPIKQHPQQQHQQQHPQQQQHQQQHPQQSSKSAVFSPSQPKIKICRNYQAGSC